MYTSAVDRYDATTGPFESDLSDRRGKTSGDLERRTSTKSASKSRVQLHLHMEIRYQ